MDWASHLVAGDLARAGGARLRAALKGFSGEWAGMVFYQHGEARAQDFITAHNRDYQTDFWKGFQQVYGKIAARIMQTYVANGELAREHRIAHCLLPLGTAKQDLKACLQELSSSEQRVLGLRYAETFDRVSSNPLRWLSAATGAVYARVLHPTQGSLRMEFIKRLRVPRDLDADIASNTCGHDFYDIMELRHGSISDPKVLMAQFLARYKREHAGERYRFPDERPEPGWLARNRSAMRERLEQFIAKIRAGEKVAPEDIVRRGITRNPIRLFVAPFSAAWHRLRNPDGPSYTEQLRKMVVLERVITTGVAQAWAQIKALGAEFVLHAPLLGLTRHADEACKQRDCDAVALFYRDRIAGKKPSREELKQFKKLIELAYQGLQLHRERVRIKANIFVNVGAIGTATAAYYSLLFLHVPYGTLATLVSLASWGGRFTVNAIMKGQGYGGREQILDAFIGAIDGPTLALGKYVKTGRYFRFLRFGRAVASTGAKYAMKTGLRRYTDKTLAEKLLKGRESPHVREHAERERDRFLEQYGRRVHAVSQAFLDSTSKQHFDKAPHIRAVFGRIGKELAV